jgi:hypothetical protein
VRQGEPQYQSDVGYVADDRTAVGSHNATKYNNGKQHMSINVCTFSGRLGRMTLQQAIAQVTEAYLHLHGNTITPERKQNSR